MITKLASVTVYVEDHDKALEFYVTKLGFKVISDVTLPGGFRWLTVAPSEKSETQIVLEHAGASGRARALPKPTGLNSTWVFHCEDCRETSRTLKERGVRITREPQERPYGIEATFEDLYGNPFALVERK